MAKGTLLQVLLAFAGVGPLAQAARRHTADASAGKPGAGSAAAFALGRRALAGRWSSSASARAAAADGGGRWGGQQRGISWKSREGDEPEEFRKAQAAVEAAPPEALRLQPISFDGPATPGGYVPFEARSGSGDASSTPTWAAAARERARAKFRATWGAPVSANGEARSDVSSPDGRARDEAHPTLAPRAEEEFDGEEYQREDRIWKSVKKAQARAEAARARRLGLEREIGRMWAPAGGAGSGAMAAREAPFSGRRAFATKAAEEPLEDEAYPSRAPAGATMRAAEDALRSAKAREQMDQVKHTPIIEDGEAYPSYKGPPKKASNKNAFPRADFRVERHFGDSAVRSAPTPPASMEEIEQLRARLEFLHTGVTMRFQMPSEYAELARDIADFAPKAFERYRGHGPGMDYWIMSHVYEVDSKAMTTMSLAASDYRNSVDVVQQAAVDTWYALARPLEKLQAEETIFILQRHIEEHNAEHEHDADELVCRDTSKKLMVKIHMTEWDQEEPRKKLMKTTTLLREEIMKDQEGRKFDWQHWTKLVTEAARELCPSKM